MTTAQIERNERQARQLETAGEGALQAYDWYTRRETPAARRARIARKAVSPEIAAALRRLWAVT